MTLGSRIGARRLTSALCVLTLAAGISGCALFESDEPGGQPTAPTPSGTTTEQPPAEPELIPEGSADDNLPLFESVVASVWASESRAQGRAYIDALTEAGFDRESMQVTEDLSTVGRAAESIQFSVSWGDAECLIGQVGPSTGDPVVTVMPQLAEGRCLVGNTRAIDW